MITVAKLNKTLLNLDLRFNEKFDSDPQLKPALSEYLTRNLRKQIFKNPAKKERIRFEWLSPEMFWFFKPNKSSNSEETDFHRKKYNEKH